MDVAEFDLRPLPFYDADVEAAGDPGPVAALKSAIREGDGLLIATPEYNHGIPGLLKNAIDWASRPPMASPLTGKPVALMGASTGFRGTARAQAHVRDALGFSKADVLAEPEVLVGEAYMKFEDGRLADEETRQAVRALLEALEEAVQERGATASVSRVLS